MVRSDAGDSIAISVAIAIFVGVIGVAIDVARNQ